MRKPRLMTPGPSAVPEEVLLELARPVIHHRSAEAKQVIAEVVAGLKEVFQTRNDVLILTAVLASGIYTVLAKSGLAFFHITLIAVLAAIVFRMSAIHWRWHEIMPGAVVGPGRPGGRAPG